MPDYQIYLEDNACMYSASEIITNQPDAESALRAALERRVKYLIVDRSTVYNRRTHELFCHNEIDTNSPVTPTYVTLKVTIHKRNDVGFYQECEPTRTIRVNFSVALGIEVL